MLKILSVLFLLTNIANAGSLDGKNVTFILEVKGLLQTNETLIANTVFKEGVMGNGFFYGPANKEMKIDVPNHCKNLVQIAFTQGLKIKFAGEVFKHQEFLTHPTLLSFNANQNFQCEVSK